MNDDMIIFFIELTLPLLIIVIILGGVIQLFSGKEVVVLTFSSAFLRFLSGVILLLYSLSQKDVTLYSLEGSFNWYLTVACGSSAFLLIPLSLLQALGTLIQRAVCCSKEAQGE
jgi:hypothetical protein